MRGTMCRMNARTGAPGTKRGRVRATDAPPSPGLLPNLTSSNVIAWHCDSPLDMERTSSSFVRGDLHGIAMSSYQQGAHRPTPELGQFVVPGTGGLYLVGPFEHPGGGVFGAGRATAQRLCEDLKIDFAKIARGR